MSGVRKGGKQGGPTSSVEYSPERLSRRRRGRERQEERWAARSGPVTVSTRVAFLNTAPCDGCGEPIDHLRHPWYPLYPDGQLCRRCGVARGLTGVMPPQDEDPEPGDRQGA